MLPLLSGLLSCCLWSRSANQWVSQLAWHGLRTGAHCHQRVRVKILRVGVSGAATQPAAQQQESRRLWRGSARRGRIVRRCHVRGCSHSGAPHVTAAANMRACIAVRSVRFDQARHGTGNTQVCAVPLLCTSLCHWLDMQQCSVVRTALQSQLLIHNVHVQTEMLVGCWG